MNPATTATVCVDAGTTLIKAVAFDDAGIELVVASRATTVRVPHPGWSEQDMHEVLEAVLECIAEAVHASPLPVGAVALTAQGDGAWMLDGDGNPVGNAVLWNDARAHEVIERWTRDGVLEAAFRINGSLGNLGLPHAILAWAVENDPSILANVDEVTTCGSWVFGALTGAHGLHPSDASAPWLDISSGAISDDLLALYGLAEARSVVPTVLREDELTRPLLPDVAERLGLTAGTPVTLAPYDVVSTAFGGGTVEPDSAFCILGTTLCTGIILDAPDTTGEPSGLTLLDGPGGAVVRAFPTLAGTGVIEWMRSLLGLAGAAELTELAGESEPGASGVGLWPYFSPAGERAPFLDPAARGVVGGLSFEHTRADLARATVEGLGHVIRDCLEASGAVPSELVLSGGGAASDLWCRSIADITGVPTRRVVGTQIGAKGALLSALVASGRFPSLVDAAAALVTPSGIFEPDATLRSFFDERHGDFLATRAALTDRWAAWAMEPRR
ncbi:MAG: FGGY family carbohydrate kinase [Actinomycetota bacterium]|nr:FGGY family carbohydrate kinase [Actinomycetota bacterium]